MPYKNVKRVVTIEFIKARRGNGYEVLVTPDQAVVRYKDTVEWNVQGLPPGHAKQIGVGNFVRLDPSLHVRHGKKGLTADVSRRGPKGPVKSKAVAGGVTLSLELGNTDPGFYKYELLADGRTLVDPEVEIRGPKG